MKFVWAVTESVSCVSEYECESEVSMGMQSVVSVWVSEWEYVSKCEWVSVLYLSDFVRVWVYKELRVNELKMMDGLFVIWLWI